MNVERPHVSGAWLAPEQPNDWGLNESEGSEDEFPGLESVGLEGSEDEELEAGVTVRHAEGGGWGSSWGSRSGAVRAANCRVSVAQWPDPGN